MSNKPFVSSVANVIDALLDERFNMRSASALEKASPDDHFSEIVTPLVDGGYVKERIRRSDGETMYEAVQRDALKQYKEFARALTEGTYTYRTTAAVARRLGVADFEVRGFANVFNDLWGVEFEYAARNRDGAELIRILD